MITPPYHTNHSVHALGFFRMYGKCWVTIHKIKLWNEIKGNWTDPICLYGISIDMKRDLTRWKLLRRN